MELELNSRSYTFFDTGARLAAAREQTQEQVVPDACPDILRIITTYGSVYASEQALHDGRAEVSGSIRASVLYLPESGEGVEHIALTIPFSHVFDVASDPGDVLFCSAELESIDARTINPRKVLVRASVRIAAKLLRRRTVELPCEVNAPASLGVRTLAERSRAKVAVCASAKTFSITDVLDLGGSPAAREVIRSKLAMLAGDCNVIGRRAVFKARAVVETLYRARNGALINHRAELPFSQIVEPEGLEEGVELHIRLRPQSLTCSVRHEDEGASLDFAFTAEAQTVGYLEREFVTVADLYSTSHRASVEGGTLELDTLAARNERRATVRGTLETAAEARDAEDAEVSFTPASVQHKDGRTYIEANADVRVRYTASDGTQYRAAGRLPVEIDVDCPANCDCLCELRAENVVATALNGIEVRFDAVADAVVTRDAELAFVKSAKLEEYGADAPARPSLVLRYPQEGESMWSLAKRFATTEEDIRDANGLAEGELPDPAKLMLIPKRR